MVSHSSATDCPFKVDLSSNWISSSRESGISNEVKLGGFFAKSFRAIPALTRSLSESDPHFLVDNVSLIGCRAVFRKIRSHCRGVLFKLESFLKTTKAGQIQNKVRLTSLADNVMMPIFVIACYFDYFILACRTKSPFLLLYTVV